MLPPYVIEQIRERERPERADRHKSKYAYLDIPAPPKYQDPDEVKPKRGVDIIDIMG